MRLPVEWIKEYAPIDAGPEEISDRLTMAGLEVEEKAESAIGAVLDIKVTPNRGDCLSVLGVARELSAAYHVKGRGLPTPTEGADAPATGLPTVSIEAPDLCPRYVARLVRNVKVGPSPQWMQDRLTAAGMRPINNIVDITNYVMLETGQPLHAFDFDSLRGGRIVVRRAVEGETLTTLDGVERALQPDMLIIADAERPVAIAGVMGGAETEMGDKTTTLLLESAHFNPLAVRRAARALDMRTEASYRFERTVDPAGVVAAAERACRLISETGAGEVVPGLAEDRHALPEERILTLRPERVGLMLGYSVPADVVIEALGRLGFVPEHKEAAAIPFRVPTWRPDIVREIDLVEEVGRVLGYEFIPETLPAGASTQGGDSEWARFAERIREILAGMGLHEIVSHSLMADNPLDAGANAAPRVAIRSALSQDLSGLRRSLIPGLVDALERNARRGQSPLAFFEVGHVFLGADGGHREVTSVGGLIAGPLGDKGWQREGRPVPADYFAGRGIVEELLHALQIQGLTASKTDDPRLHPGRGADLLLNGEKIGIVGELHPALASELTVRERVVIFELSFEALQSAESAGQRFTPLTPYPAVTRDLAPRLAAETTYSDVEQAVASVSLPFLERLTVTDLFTGAPLPEGTKSLTLSLTFRAQDRTLTDDEVNDALARIRAALETACGATFAG